MKRNCLIILIAVTLTISLIENSVEAKVNETEDAKITLQTVSLFKNGLGYFNSTAVLPKKTTNVRLGQLPVPAYGTFWVGYLENVDVRRITTGLEEVEDTIPINSLPQLLQENTGHRIRLTIGAKDQDAIEGTLLGFAKSDDRDEPGNPYFMDERLPNNHNSRRHMPSGNMVLIETADGTVAVSAGTIKRADFIGSKISTSTSVIKKRPSINIELGKPAGGKEISISYLAKGITWSPSYHIDLSDPEKARLSAKALVINEVIDLDGVTLELVTGFPNIQFGEVLSPMAMSQNLADFLQSLAGGRTESRHRRSHMTQQAILSNAAFYEAPALPNYSAVTEGMVSEDLFLYPVEDFTLKKGETAYLPLFTAEVPYRHVYTWKINDFIDEREQYRSDRERTDAKTTEEVWHACRLVNELKMPLTTAAAEFVKNGKFVGQDICYYTAPGTETTIRINRAMNVIAEQTEFEIERKHNADRFYNHNYDLVKVRGELKLRSRLDKAADVEITKELSGEIIENSDEARDTKTAKGLKRVNPKHILTWEITLEPGQEVKLTYVYEVYVRN